MSQQHASFGFEEWHVVAFHMAVNSDSNRHAPFRVLSVNDGAFRGSGDRSADGFGTHFELGFLSTIV